MTARIGRRRRQKRHKLMARDRRAKASVRRVLHALADGAMNWLRTSAAIARAIRR